MDRIGMIETVFSIMLIILGFFIFSLAFNFLSESQAGVIESKSFDLDANLVLLNLMRSNLSEDENVADLVVLSIKDDNYDKLWNVAEEKLNFNNYTWKIFVQDGNRNELTKINRKDWVFDPGSEVSKGEVMIPNKDLTNFYYVILELRRGRLGVKYVI